MDVGFLFVIFLANVLNYLVKKQFNNISQNKCFYRLPILDKKCNDPFPFCYGSFGHILRYYVNLLFPIFLHLLLLDVVKEEQGVFY